MKGRSVTYSVTSFFTRPIALLCLLAASVSCAHADDAAQWGAGVIAGVDRKPYRGMESDKMAVPLVTYQSRYISVLGPGIDFKLPSDGPLQVALRARYSDDGYKAKDSAYLTGMAEREASFWVGPMARVTSGDSSATLEVLADAMGNSKGRKAALTLEHAFEAGALTIAPRVSAQWHDDKFVDYYYGVRATEALAQRRRFDGSASTNVEFGLRLTHIFAQRHMLMLDLSSTRLGGAIKDSPLVERTRSSQAYAGYFYYF